MPGYPRGATPKVAVVSDQIRSRDPGPVLVTRDPVLAESVAAVGVALGREPARVCDAGPLRGSWSGAALRLVGLDMLPEVSGFASLPDTYVVGAAGDRLLEASVRTGWPVIALPAAAAELAEILSRTAEAARRGRVYEVWGASGGLGVSSLVVALAVRAAASGLPSAAVELADCGGGLDLLFGAETRPGMRWGELAHASGQLGLLAEQLPSRSGVSILALSRDNPVLPGPVARAAVLEGLARAFGVVMLDVGARGAPGPDRHRVERLLVVGADVSSVAAARMMIETRDPGAVRLVVRTGRGRSLPANAVAEAVGAPLLGTLREDRSVPRLATVGQCVASRSTGRFSRDVARIWRELRP